MKHIEAETLRSWLENSTPVTVLDIRSDEDRVQWSIPESLHVNAYEELKAGRTSVLRGLNLPEGKPVVTVCNFGRMAAIAAGELAKQGKDVFVLQGGMKAWSTAWNTAVLDLRNVSITQVRRTGKGCLSYFVASSVEAIVIDAALAPEVFIQLAKDQAVRIRYVLDTHIHADHISRSRVLAERVNAELILPSQDRVRFSYRPIQPGEELHFGEAVLKAIATPGHTLESTSYLLNGEALFTGDTLFLSGVGRPDLHAAEGAARDRAKLLVASLKQLLALGPEVFVLPGHTSQPVAFDGKTLTARMGDVGSRIEHRLNSASEFIEQILSRVPGTPPNYTRITELNEAGEVSDGDLNELEAGANRCAVV